MSSGVREALEAYLAGRIQAERVVIAASVAYYRDGGAGKRQALRPLIDVIDRASPGIVELAHVEGGSGFEVRLAERSFPRQYEPDLRRAAEAYLQGKRSEAAAPPAPAPRRGVLGRLLGAVRRLLSPSA